MIDFGAGGLAAAHAITRPSYTPDNSRQSFWPPGGQTKLVQRFRETEARRMSWKFRTLLLVRATIRTLRPFRSTLLAKSQPPPSKAWKNRRIKHAPCQGGRGGAVGETVRNESRIERTARTGRGMSGRRCGDWVFANDVYQSWQREDNMEDVTLRRGWGTRTRKGVNELLSCSWRKRKRTTTKRKKIHISPLSCVSAVCMIIMGLRIVP